MGHGPAVLEGCEDEEVGVVVEGDVSGRLRIVTLLDLELEDRRGIDGAAVSGGCCND